MARVIIEKGSANPTTRKIANALEKDNKGFFYLITNFATKTDIWRGKEEAYNPNLPYCNAGYYATIDFNVTRELFELVESKGGKNREIYWFGAFKSPLWAAKNLLRLGTHSFNGRKPLRIYK